MYSFLPLCGTGKFYAAPEDSFCQSWQYVCVVVDIFDSELKICDR